MRPPPPLPAADDRPAPRTGFACTAPFAVPLSHCLAVPLSLVTVVVVVLWRGGRRTQFAPCGFRARREGFREEM